RGLAEPPSGPLPAGDALDAGRADARRLLRSPPLAASHHHGVLTPPLVAATPAPDTARPLSASTHGRSIPPPSPVSRAATAWLSRCRGWAQAVVEADVSWHEANRRYNRPDTRPTAAATRLRPCTAC